jgi:hypothetical protein
MGSVQNDGTMKNGEFIQNLRLSITQNLNFAVPVLAFKTCSEVHKKYIVGSAGVAQFSAG